MKFYKRIGTFSVTAALLVTMLCGAPLAEGHSAAAVHAEASGTNGAANPALTFADVREDDWFYDDVTKLHAAGVINGYPDGLFHPEGEITTAEFIKVLICAIGGPMDFSHRLYSWHWASDYISAAYKLGIITDADIASGFSPGAPITRSAMTKMMILALGIDPARIDDPFTDISDMYASTAYNEYLLRGYLMEDGSRIYNGSGNALRSEAAAIAMRVMEYKADSYSYKRDQILANAAENPLNTESELIDLFYVLNREFMSEFTFETSIPLGDWQEYYTHSNILRVEYFYSSAISIRYNRGGGTVYTIMLQYNRDVEELKALRRAAEEKADKIIASIITDNMSDYERVKAIHDYIILNCEYDYANYLTDTLPYETRLAYGVLCDRKAVCQGYCAAFNLLCERAGVRSVAIGGYAPNSNVYHAWNMVLIDGQILYIDTTHDDPVPDRVGKTSYRYFCLTESEMASLGYVWDKNYSNLKYFY